MNDPSRVSVFGPLAPFAEGFLHSLLKVGYTQDSAASQLQLIAHLSRWLVAEGLDVHSLHQNDLERFFHVRHRAGYTHNVSLKAMLPMLTYLRTQGISLSLPLLRRRGGRAGYCCDELTNALSGADVSDLDRIAGGHRDARRRGHCARP